MNRGTVNSAHVIAQEIPTLIDWGMAAHACRGELESGDALLVKAIPHGVLIGVADGLGHGVQAAESARAALGLAESHATDSLTDIVQLCHFALRKMRGAALTLVAIDESTGTLTWLGVGTVAGTLLHAGAGLDTHSSLLLRGGVLGQRVPAVTSASLPIAPGDTLVLVTTGARWYADRTTIPRGTPDVMAHRLLAESATPDEDALVVVARYRGEGGTRRRFGRLDRRIRPR